MLDLPENATNAEGEETRGVAATDGPATRRGVGADSVQRFVAYEAP
jgi:hypothetical protein